jgi:tryptophan synthase alpha chain
VTSRITAAFDRLRQNGNRGLVAYVTAGDPTLDRTAEILVALSENGADVLEVGVPFSDPLADGPVIQRASERALASGTTLRKTVEMIAACRARISAPIVLFTYVNPILRFGEEPFVRAAAGAGIDGVLMLDLPVEEAASFRDRLAAASIDPIFLVSPTTTDARIEASAALGSGFLYLISRLGVTGARDEVSSGAETLARRVRAQSPLPLALGFGISRPEHVAEVCRWVDAAVVGSALVNVIAEHGASADVAARAGGFIRWLKTGQA